MQLSTLRGVLEVTGQPPIRQLARLPGVSEIIRVVVHYFDGRGRDSVATLFCTRMGARMEIIYRGALAGKSLIYPIPESRPPALNAALRHAGFDKLPDQEPLPEHDTSDAWMVERAAGAFAHGIILMPDLAEGAYALIASAIRQHLPEALKQIR